MTAEGDKDGDRRLTIEVARAIADAPAADWDRCAGADHPFVQHRFLAALEESESACDAQGWAPHHLLLKSDDGALVGCAPLYLKFHSYGEYVFDHGWAAAFERAGGRYYPKLQSAAPFTPATGPRLLVDATDADAPTVERRRRALADAMAALCADNGLSSAHVTFPTEDDWRVFERAGWLLRTGQQYHWLNEGYASFDDFLGALASRKRKTLRKERETANSHGVAFQMLTGADLRPEHWDAFFDFYIDTSDRKWGSPYLTRAFFHRIGETMADDILLVMGVRDGTYVCGALNFIGEDTLYGRNWGGIVDLPMLHFEACYYRAMDFAIERGLTRVEAGAQGAHKIQRGYAPTPNYSAHFIPDRGFRSAVADFLKRETEAVTEEIDRLGDYTPFRKGDIGG